MRKRKAPIPSTTRPMVYQLNGRLKFLPAGLDSNKGSTTTPSRP